MISTLSELQFNDTFGALGAAFSTPQHPTPLPQTHLIAQSPDCLELLKISSSFANSSEFLSLFSGNQIAPNSTPRAAVYSGHQFGVWAGQLGDGRAILLGDLAGFEVQLKGAGATPYSRRADGRAVLRSSIREFLCSEAFAGLGIPTTRALCLIGSPQYVMREQPETTAVVTRIAPSFVRFGSFEHWFYQDNIDALKQLADFVIDTHFSKYVQDEKANRYATFLEIVTKRTAKLIAQWQSVGFMHGVMNTDNMSILGLTLDYGPFGFMEAFNPHHICNHSDEQGRYSYANQPNIAEWNCYALGQALLPLIGTVQDTKAALAHFAPTFKQQYQQLWLAKLGLKKVFETDNALIEDTLKLMRFNRLDFTYFFRQLSYLSHIASPADHLLRDLCIDTALFDAWLSRYRERLKLEEVAEQQRHIDMQAVNPKYILRNYLAQNAIDLAQKNDFSEVNKLRQILARPFDEQPQHEAYAALPPDWAATISVSCSS